MAKVKTEAFCSNCKYYCYSTIHNKKLCQVENPLTKLRVKKDRDYCPLHEFKK